MLMQKNEINLENINIETYETINHIIKLLNSGKIRISEKKENIWITHQWLKKQFCYICI